MSKRVDSVTFNEFREKNFVVVKVGVELFEDCKSMI